MSFAVNLSRQAVRDDVGGPFGAVVVCEGRVVGTGRNRVLADSDPTAHAEVVALRAASRHLGDHVLRNCEVYASSEPCPMCLGALYWARVGRLFFANTRQQAAAIGFDDEQLYREAALPLGERTLQCVHIPSKAATKVFSEWSSRHDRILY